MAKILFTTFSNLPGGKLDSFRQGLVDALVREGNEVRVLLTNHFIANYHATNLLLPGVRQEALLEDIKAFGPDLILSMNHSGLFPGLTSAVECPIAVWLLDGPAYLIDPDEVRRQAGRYQLFISTRNFRQELMTDYGYPSASIHYMPFCSDFQATKLEGDVTNIAFIGTFFATRNLTELLAHHLDDAHTWNSLRALLADVEADIQTPFSEQLAKHHLAHVFSNEFDEAYFFNTLALNRRVKVLDSVVDLGLTLYGDRNWLQASPFSAALALAFQPRPIITKADLEGVYNRSRINLNISHAQARGGLPWRIFDIMACGGALVSDYQSDLEALFGDQVQIPTYRSPAEARALCQALLADPARREALVAESHAAIDQGHRFIHRLASMGEALGMGLLPGGTGQLGTFDAARYTSPHKAPGTGRADGPAITPFQDEWAALDRRLQAKLAQGNLERALDAIVRYAEIAADPAAVCVAYGSPALDGHCQAIGRLIHQGISVDRPPAVDEQTVVYLVTELYRKGGHTGVLEDLIKAQPGKRHVILASDVYCSLERDAAHQRLTAIGAELIWCPEEKLVDKVKWLQSHLLTARPGRVFLLNHNQDAVAIAAAIPEVAERLVFYHHADHTFCLGVHLDHALHIDPHSFGYHHCRTELGHPRNGYLPLTVDTPEPAVPRTASLQERPLRTCTSGSHNKFTKPYMFPYQEVVPRLLATTQGEHLHIGELPASVLEAIAQGLVQRGVDPARFVHVRSVKSLADTLKTHEIDVYVSSFPIGGGRATVEAMAAGIPFIGHENYEFKFLGCDDIAYPEAYFWKTPDELCAHLAALTPEALAFQAARARAYYEAHHTPALVRETLARLLAGEPVSPFPTVGRKRDTLRDFLIQRAVHRIKAGGGIELATRQGVATHELKMVLRRWTFGQLHCRWLRVRGKLSRRQIATIKSAVLWLRK